MKVCIKCGLDQELDCYFKRPKSTDGHENTCKTCKKLYKQEHYQKNKAQLRQKNREYVAANRDAVQAYRNKWQREHPEKMRDSYLWNRYRIRLDEYNILLEQQEGCCKICSKTPEELGEVLVVDHDHETDGIRGLLCSYCNKGLGHFFDSVQLLQAAQEYLLNHRESGHDRSRTICDPSDEELPH